MLLTEQPEIDVCNVRGPVCVQCAMCAALVCAMCVAPCAMCVAARYEEWEALKTKDVMMRRVGYAPFGPSHSPPDTTCPVYGEFQCPGVFLPFHTHAVKHCKRCLKTDEAFLRNKTASIAQYCKCCSN